MPLQEHIWYINTAEWFDRNLDYPHCFYQPIFPHVQRKAKSWFKFTWTDFMANSLAVVALLRKHGIVVITILSDDPGEFIYESSLQVVALPRAYHEL